jgi:phage gp29-like protein
MAMSNEEKIMLSSALVSIGRNIEALIPSTMKYALAIAINDDEPQLIYSGEMTSYAVAKVLRTIADRIDPPKPKEPITIVRKK